MEQKKKRVRPSLTQMRLLQAELDKVKENYRLQLIADKQLAEELEILRDKLRSCKEDLESQVDGTGNLVKDCNAWREKFVS